MNEYDFDNFNDFQESHHFSDIFLNEHEIQQKIEAQHQNLQNHRLNFQKQQNFPTNFTCSIPTSEYPTSKDHDIKFQNQTNMKKKGRKIRKIETNSKVQLINKFTFSGSKNDTVELNTNFKTLFLKYFRQIYKADTNKNADYLNEFQNSVPSFKAFQDLYNSDHQIKEQCRSLIRSTSIIKKVMGSRAKFWTRLQMIKYIETLNQNSESNILVRWKSVRKLNF